LGRLFYWVRQCFVLECTKIHVGVTATYKAFAGAVVFALTKFIFDNEALQKPHTQVIGM